MAFGIHDSIKNIFSFLSRLLRETTRYTMSNLGIIPTTIIAIPRPIKTQDAFLWLSGVIFENFTTTHGSSKKSAEADTLQTNLGKVEFYTEAASSLEY